jgi:hypothetical protein
MTDTNLRRILVPPSIRSLGCQRSFGTRRNCSFDTFSITGAGSGSLKTYRKCKGILLRPSSTHMRVRLLLMLNTFRTRQSATDLSSQCFTYNWEYQYRAIFSSHVRRPPLHESVLPGVASTTNSVSFNATSIAS